VFRESNSTMDWLANYGLSKSPIDWDYTMIDDPSSSLFFISYYDLIRSIVAHLIFIGLLNPDFNKKKIFSYIINLHKEKVLLMLLIISIMLLIKT
jgi:hypothetical protein